AAAYTPVDVVGTLADPEGDRVSVVDWQVDAHDASGQPIGVTVTLVSDYDPTTGSQPHIRIDTPESGATVDVQLGACDEFGACAATNVAISIL
ncbi:MAG: hypothetical protein HYZ27_09340, partial [Deltaproteobacteria bacterium]|nr:hypothetical protein [Deltaproteobacteria bacterium]